MPEILHVCESTATVSSAGGRFGSLMHRMTTQPPRPLEVIVATLVTVSIGASLLGGCGGPSEPRYSLQMVMLEVEISKKKLEAALLTDGDASGVETSARRIRDWLADSAVDRYLERRDLKGTVEQFRAFESSFETPLDQVLAAAVDDDVEGARKAYPSLVAGCNACHAVFRPDLPR